MQQFRGGEFMVADIIHDSLSVIANASRRPFSVIFKGLVTKGMNYHNPQLPEGQRTNGQHLPLAILDFYTGYKLTDKPTLERCLGESWNPTDTNIDRFFSTHRNTFHSFRSSPTSWQVRYISSLAEHLNVKTSSAASPTSPANPSPSGN